MASREDNKLKNVGQVGEGYVRGVHGWNNQGGKNYTITFPNDTTTTVNIVDKSSRATQIAQAEARLDKLRMQALNTKNPARAQQAASRIPAAEEALHAVATAPPRGSSVLRLDNPHQGHMYPHINLNPDISGIPDPHTRISPGMLKAGTNTAKVVKVLNRANKVMVPIAVATDVVQLGKSIYDDVENSTSRNTVETLVDIGGGWGGGVAGAAAGATAGSLVLPGVGTLIGGIIGGIGGAIGGGFGADAAVNAIGDANDYDMKEKICKRCGRKFKVRLYLGEEKRNYCDNCSQY